MQPKINKLKNKEQILCPLPTPWPRTYPPGVPTSQNRARIEWACREFVTGAGTASWKWVSGYQEPRSLAPRPVQTHCVQPVTFLIVARAAREVGRRRFRVGGWLGISWRERTKAWQTSLARSSGMWVRKCWWQSPEVREPERKRKRVACELSSATNGIRKASSCKTGGSAPLHSLHWFLTGLNLHSRVLGTFQKNSNTFHFLFVPFCVLA